MKKTDEMLTEQDDIVITCLDYIEGWYSGDSARIERAIHPELAKRIQETTATGELVVEHSGAKELVNWTAQGIGKADPHPRSDVQILDIFGRTASVRIDAGSWVDYLHLIHTSKGWKIINVLWERR